MCCKAETDKWTLWSLGKQPYLVKYRYSDFCVTAIYSGKNKSWPLFHIFDQLTLKHSKYLPL